MCSFFVYRRKYTIEKKSRVGSEPESRQWFFWWAFSTWILSMRDAIKWRTCFWSRGCMSSPGLTWMAEWHLKLDELQFGKFQTQRYLLILLEPTSCQRLIHVVQTMTLRRLKINIKKQSRTINKKMTFYELTKCSLLSATQFKLIHLSNFFNSTKKSNNFH